MAIETLFMVMMMVVMVMAWWANFSKRSKIYCSFTREDRTSIHRFVKKISRYVVFDGRRYDILWKCVVFDWWDKGLVHMLFPQWVATLEFTYNSRWPIDKSTGKPAVISPEVRQAMNKEEWVKSYAKGFTPPTAKKQTMVQQWLPWLSIGLVALLFFYVYSNNQVLMQSLAELTNRVNATAR